MQEFDLNYEGGAATPSTPRKIWPWSSSTSGYMGRLDRDFPDVDYGVSLIPYNTEPVSWMAGFGVEMPVDATPRPLGVRQVPDGLRIHGDVG